MITLLNYANHYFHDAQRKNARTGKSVGGFDRVLSYGPQDIDKVFYQRNKVVLDAPKGNGYWLWKPYFIERTLREMPEGDWLFYCDAGSYFISSIAPLVELARASGEDILTFADAHPERKYSKRDAFLTLEADVPEITDTPQRLGGFSLWRNTPVAREFAATWLRHAQNPQLITDAENTFGQPNYPEFMGHRHDQSVFSILAKKHGLPAFRDPSQWGNERLTEYPNASYPQLVELTRQRDIPLRTRMKRRVKRWLGMP